MATDRNTVPFLTTETTAEKSTLFWEKLNSLQYAGKATSCIENALSQINLGYKLQLIPDQPRGLGQALYAHWA